MAGGCRGKGIGVLAVKCSLSAAFSIFWGGSEVDPAGKQGTAFLGEADFEEEVNQDIDGEFLNFMRF